MIRDFLIEIFLIPLKIYRKFISPFIPPRCKYYPTCSTYALEAVRRFGIIKGSLLAFKRVIRCNPWSLGGIDPVPEKYSYFEKWRKKSALK